MSCKCRYCSIAQDLPRFVLPAYVPVFLELMALPPFLDKARARTMWKGYAEIPETIKGSSEDKLRTFINHKHIVIKTRQQSQQHNNNSDTICCCTVCTYILYFSPHLHCGHGSRNIAAQVYLLLALSGCLLVSTGYQPYRQAIAGFLCLTFSLTPPRTCDGNSPSVTCPGQERHGCPCCRRYYAAGGNGDPFWSSYN